jgi:pimeloyl-ACP methyl ester carboxylesterase
MVESRTVEVAGGRTVGVAVHGSTDGFPVLWCHGGPGSRLEPAPIVSAAANAGVRLIGIDRPGYGWSTPWPGRSIAGWVPDAIAVADELALERFATVGVSTGGAYALAIATLAPDRVVATVACCAVTDMRWDEGKAMMTGPGAADIWAAPDRDVALAIAASVFGEDGSKMLQPADAPALAPADLALLADPAFLATVAEGMAEMFAHGVQGYTDDRIADGVGWGSFDVSTVRSPVVVVHGAEDTIVPVAHAHHTASIVPGATLRIIDDLGHLSILPEIVPALASVLPARKPAR